FRPVGDGTLLRAGMTIRTGESSYAVLTYFEGSTVSIEPNTTLVIEALEANPDGSTVISMQQQAGRTWHSVTKLLNQGSKYEVKTPTLTATVRGTAFEVGVEQDTATGEVVSRVVTTEGAVGASKPATAAEPAPPEVIVPAGFQATARAAEPVAPPEPAPEPERKVTVTVGTSNAVVVDPLGRANGERDGKLILQTPGAKVTKVDGKLVVTLPKISDGKISTVLSPASRADTREQAAPVSVVTVVSERGRGDTRSEETVQLPANASAPAVVTGVEVKRSDSAQPAEVRVLAPSERQNAPAPKLTEPQKPPEAPKPELLPAPEKKNEPGTSEGGNGAKVSGVVDVFVRSTLPPLSVEAAAKRAEESRKAEERAKEEAAKREEQRRRENDQRAEGARKAEERAKEEAARLSDERRRAEEKAKEEISKKEEAAKKDTSPGPVGGGSVVQEILKVIAPAVDTAKEAEKKVGEARKAEDKAKDEAARLSDERRKAEDAKRQDDIKRAEEQRKQADQNAEELRKAEDKAKQESAKDLERVRSIEAKAREQTQKLETDKRREAEKLIEEFRKSEDKAREEATKRLEDQRKGEERAKEEAERKLTELRQAQERSKEEAARAAEERQRDDQRKSEERTRQQRSTSGFVPQVQDLDPLPGRRGERGDPGR
ncbi:MAG: FecR domain-containing protein, partial [Chloroflexi bacterium]|nr:FecR domain-containing protein [Chloroflexota bacterium]